MYRKNTAFFSIVVAVFMATPVSAADFGFLIDGQANGLYRVKAIRHNADKSIDTLKEYRCADLYSDNDIISGLKKFYCDDAEIYFRLNSDAPSLVENGVDYTVKTSSIKIDPANPIRRISHR